MENSLKASLSDLPIFSNIARFLKGILELYNNIQKVHFLHIKIHPYLYCSRSFWTTNSMFSVRYEWIQKLWPSNSWAAQLPLAPLPSPPPWQTPPYSLPPLPYASLLTGFTWAARRTSCVCLEALPGHLITSLSESFFFTSARQVEWTVVMCIECSAETLAQGR